MVKHFLSLILVIGINFSLYSQGLFDSFTAEADSSQNSKTKIEFSGYVRGSAYGGSEKFDFTNTFGEFALKGKLSKQKSFLFADIRLREGLFYNNLEQQIQLKEAFAGYRGNKVDFYLGNQIVSWGKTDGFNPTNSITPNDYFFLTYEPDDQKMSNFMFRSKFRFSNSVDIELIAIPFYVPSNYRYDLFQEQAGVFYWEVESPIIEFNNSTLASRLSFELPRIGFSLSYFNGYDPFYGFSLRNFTLIPLEINYLPTPYRKQSFGGDFAIPIKSWIVRGESAFNLTKNYEQNMHVPNPDVYYVFGIEKGFFDITAIFQYIGKYTLDFKELIAPVLGGYTQEDFMQYGMEVIPYESTMYNRRIFNQQEQTNHALMLSLSRSFLYEEVRVELTGYYNITSEEYLVRSRIKWNITDVVTANIGAHYMFGPESSIYDMSGKVMNGVFMGLEVGF